MTEVETLLSVDAGHVPPDTLVFTVADPEVPTRRLYAFMAATGALGAVGCLLQGTNHQAALLLGLIAGILVVLALPPAPEPDEPRHKPATLVVAPHGMIVRDDSGLRTWRFDELAAVHPYEHGDSKGLLLVRLDGSREFLDCESFSRGERLVDVIGRRLRPRAS